MERRGIPTVCVQLLRKVALAVRPPRSLLVPFRHGFPLGAPNHPELQRRVIDEALAMVWNEKLSPPALTEMLNVEC